MKIQAYPIEICLFFVYLITMKEKIIIYGLPMLTIILGIIMISSFENKNMRMSNEFTGLMLAFTALMWLVYFVVILITAFVVRKSTGSNFVFTGLLYSVIVFVFIIIIASVVNMFLQSPGIYWILTYAGMTLL